MNLILEILAGIVSLLRRKDGDAGVVIYSVYWLVTTFSGECFHELRVKFKMLTRMGSRTVVTKLISFNFEVIVKNRVYLELLRLAPAHFYCSSCHGLRFYSFFLIV